MYKWNGNRSLNCRYLGSTIFTVVRAGGSNLTAWLYLDSTKFVIKQVDYVTDIQKLRRKGAFVFKFEETVLVILWQLWTILFKFKARECDKIVVADHSVKSMSSARISSKLDNWASCENSQQCELIKFIYHFINFTNQVSNYFTET
jgi:hypothetical protein